MWQVCVIRTLFQISRVQSIFIYWNKICPNQSLFIAIGIELVSFLQENHKLKTCQLALDQKLQDTIEKLSSSSNQTSGKSIHLPTLEEVNDELTSLKTKVSLDIEDIRRKVIHINAKIDLRHVSTTNQLTEIKTDIRRMKSSRTHQEPTKNTPLRK